MSWCRTSAVSVVAVALVLLVSGHGVAPAAAAGTLLNSGINYDQLDWPRVRLTLETPGGGPINGNPSGSFPDTTAPAGATLGQYLDIPDFIETVANALALSGAGTFNDILPQILYREDLITYDSTAKQTTMALVFGVGANDPTTTTTTARRFGTTTTANAMNTTTTVVSEGGSLARQLRQVLITGGIKALTPYTTYRAVFGDTPTFAPTTTYLETFTPVPTFNISEIGANGTVFEESSSSAVAMAVGISLGVIVVLVMVGVGYSVYQNYKTKGMRSGNQAVGNAAKYATSEV